MKTDSSLEEIWEATRKSILEGPCATMPLRDLEKDTQTKAVFSNWKKREGTAATYAALSYDELCAHPDFSKDPKRIERLIRLFKETASYDMSLVGISSKVGRKNTVSHKFLNQLKALEIDPSFPLKLMTISSPLKHFFDSEGVTEVRGIFSQSAHLCDGSEEIRELAAIKSAFLSGEPEHIGKYIPLNPTGESMSLQGLMRGFMQSRATEPNALQAYAQRLGRDSNPHPDVAPAPQDQTDSFLREATAYYADAEAFCPNDANLLRSTMHDHQVFERSIRLIEDPDQKFLIHYIVCKFYKVPFPERKGGGFFANNKMINRVKRAASGVFQR